MSTFTCMCSRSIRHLSVVSGVFRSRVPNTWAAFSTTAAEPNSSTTTDDGEKVPDKTEQSSGSSSAELKFSEQKKKLDEQLKAVQDKYMRSLAETENVRNRMKKQIDNAKIFGIQGFCKDLLEVADVLGKATESVPETAMTADNPHLKDLIEGLKMTEAQLHQTFTRHGLMQILPKEGEKFDPYIHQAMFEVPAMAGKEGGTVAILEKVGYTLHERTLRPAQVGVFKDAS